MAAPILPTPTAQAPPNAAAGVVQATFSNAQTYALASYTTAFSAIGDIRDNLQAISYTSLVNWLTAAITSGGTGLSDSAIQDLLDMEQEQDEIIKLKTIDELSRVWAKGDWALPDGILEASISGYVIDFNNKQLDKTRKIRVEQEQLEIANIHFAVQQYTLLVTGYNSIVEKGIESIGSIAAQLAAAALSSAHAQAHVGYDTSQSLQGHINNSTSMSSSWSTSISE